MKITEFNKTTTLADDDVFLVDGVNGTNTITKANLSAVLNTRLSGTDKYLTKTNLAETGTFNFNSTGATGDNLIAMGSETSSASKYSTVIGGITTRTTLSAPVYLGNRQTKYTGTVNKYNTRRNGDGKYYIYDYMCNSCSFKTEHHRRDLVPIVAM